MKQIEKVIEQCNMAYLSKTPILYLETDDYELVNEIACSNRIAELYYRVEEDGKVEYYTQREMIKRGYSLDEISPINLFIDIYQTPRIPGEPKSFSGKVSPPVIHVVHNYDPGLGKVGQASDKELVKYVERYMNSDDADPKNIRRTLVMLASSTVKIPQGLENYVQIIDVPALEDVEIREIIDDFITKEKQKYNYNISESFLDEMVTRFRGLDKHKILEILYKIKSKNGCVCDISDEWDKTAANNKKEIAISYIKKEKEQVIKKTGILSYIEIEQNTVDVGGLEVLKEWLDEQNTILESYEVAKKWRIEFAKGLLITGVPGCGKSLMAKYTASKFNVPLVQMDMGALQNSLLGESEANMRKALKIVESMAPCVLWIDEVEKGLSGSKGDGSSDGGTSQRMLATLLTWLQENKELIFSFITANDISKLPPELLRLGRISKKYSVAIPTYEECIKIFLAQISRKTKDRNGKRTENLFDREIQQRVYWEDILEYCAINDKFLTGGDIEVIINTALSKYFLSQKEEMPHYKADKFKEYLKKTIDETSPFGKTNMRDIVKYQILQEENQFEYAAKNKVIANKLEEEIENKNNVNLDNIYDINLRKALLLKYDEIISEK